MRILEAAAELSAVVAGWRAAGERVAFVPTMGNLHAGHLSLVEYARGIADRVVASIYVNPTQFNDPDDFARYPKTMDEDSRRLKAAGCDLLFAPDEATVYPFGKRNAVLVDEPVISQGLCGAFRPGHFRGVTTVVCRLFNLVRPDVAVFGQKDLQQLRVIERMVADLHMPVQVEGLPTVREADGLAMSSRNGRLTPEDRQNAAVLYRVLAKLRDQVAAGRHDYAAIQDEAMNALEAGGFRPEYVEVRCWDDLSSPKAGRSLVVLAAAWLGDTRLIDNLPI
ncbi:MAG: pantoate--beta-alanine ligase [Gammaproteobacteria bacterium]|nr:pantoate--beta-alanine ligase [Gammaproteobacteria bacterium]